MRPRQLYFSVWQAGVTPPAFVFTTGPRPEHRPETDGNNQPAGAQVEQSRDLPEQFARAGELPAASRGLHPRQIGRASGRGSEWQYVSSSGGAGSLQKQQNQTEQ